MICNGEVGDWRLSDAEFLEHFSLSSKRALSLLAQQYPVFRDDRIKFNEERHLYTFDGVRVPISVTGLLHAYAQRFDAQEAIARNRSDYQNHHREMREIEAKINRDIRRAEHT